MQIRNAKEITSQEEEKHSALPTVAFLTNQILSLYTIFSHHQLFQSMIMLYEKLLHWLHEANELFHNFEYYQQHCLQMMRTTQIPKQWNRWNANWSGNSQVAQSLDSGFLVYHANWCQDNQSNLVFQMQMVSI